MRNHNQNDDDKFIKDQWFDDYCFHKLVIEEENHPSSASKNGGCSTTAIAIFLIIALIIEIINAL